ncbi:MAG: hypothetical protein HQK81_06175 [Desulfovibrionaceae bacterium]|nr:hypothetical protein [Desulfovibrionaceae bacterium]MBF0513636.1 hypothetical protein [Desulfovibrionaceae bacterium]
MSDLEALYLEGGRELCQTGCCILTAAEDLLGESIRFFEGRGATCSHAAPVVRLPAGLMSRDRVTLIEALAHGLTPTYLSHYGEGFKGRIFLFTPAGLTPEIQAAFSAWLLDKMFAGTAYDYSALFAQIGGHVGEDTRKLFCSEAYACALEAAGLPRLPTAPAGVAPQPSDIASWWPGSLVELKGPFKEGS